MNDLNIAEKIDLAIQEAASPSIIVLNQHGYNRLLGLVGDIFMANIQNGIVFEHGILKRFRNLRIIKSSDLDWQEVIVK